MVSINLVSQRGHAILPDKHGSINLLVANLSLLHFEAEGIELGLENSEDGIARQPFRERLTADLVLCGRKTSTMLGMNAGGGSVRGYEVNRTEVFAIRLLQGAEPLPRLENVGVHQ